MWLYFYLDFLTHEFLTRGSPHDLGVIWTISFNKHNRSIKSDMWCAKASLVEKMLFKLFNPTRSCFTVVQQQELILINYCLTYRYFLDH